MTPEIGNGGKAWDLLIDRLDSIEGKVDHIAIKVDNWQGACITHNQTTAEHEVKISDMGTSIKWLYGILAGLVVAVLVEVVRRG